RRNEEAGEAMPFLGHLVSRRSSPFLTEAGVPRAGVVEPGLRERFLRTDGERIRRKACWHGDHDAVGAPQFDLALSPQQGSVGLTASGRSPEDGDPIPCVCKGEVLDGTTGFMRPLVLERRNGCKDTTGLGTASAGISQLKQCADAGYFVTL